MFSSFDIDLTDAPLLLMLMLMPTGFTMLLQLAVRKGTEGVIERKKDGERIRGRREKKVKQ
jgi:hypothetical protein